MTHTRESLIRDISRYAKTVQGPIRLTEFCRARKFAIQPIYNLFPRGFGELLAAAGLQNRCYRIGRVTKEDLLAEIDAVVSELRRMPTRAELHRKARFSPTAFGRHLGTWKQLTTAYNLWKSGTRRAITPPISTPRTHRAKSNSPKPSHRRRNQPQPTLGAPLGFRGLLHAPTCESGVIHLFGLLGPDLGFAIESITPSYPDCHALRQDPKNPNRWRRLTIEFEYSSSNFRAHLHDPKHCDLIVCWEHDWPDCPLEVLELKPILERLTAPNKPEPRHEPEVQARP